MRIRKGAPGGRSLPMQILATCCAMRSAFTRSAHRKNAFVHNRFSETALILQPHIARTMAPGARSPLRRGEEAFGFSSLLPSLLTLELGL